MYNSGSYADLLEPGLRKVYADTFYLEQQQSIASILFNVQESRKAQEHDLEMGDVADFAPFAGQVPYDDTGEGYKTNYVHQEFARGMKVERKLVDDDLYNVIARRPQQLGLAAFRKRETDAASVFVNAFVTNITGGDGVCLGNAAHPSNNGGPSQSNVGTTALSPTEVDTARIKMVKYQSNRGNPLTIQPDMLIVPVDLESYAYEIINSRGKVDTAQNNVNFHVGRYKLVVWPNYLVSTTKWFLVDSKIMKMYLNWFDRITPQFYKDTDFDTLVAKFAGYMRYSYGWSDWRWLYAENA
jgi:phage major head subunit gpT-like protein